MAGAAAAPQGIRLTALPRRKTLRANAAAEAVDSGGRHGE
jgi:hypothetical protein